MQTFTRFLSIAGKFVLMILFFATTSAVDAQVTDFGVELSKQNEQVYIKWWARNQADVELYQVFRSENGKNWRLVASVDGTGDSEGKYEAMDENPSDGRNVYRFDIHYRNANQEIAGYEYIYLVEPTTFETITILPDFVYANLVNSVGGEVIITNMRGMPLFKGDMDQLPDVKLPRDMSGLFIVTRLDKSGKFIDQKKVMLVD
jgi:hypothetical protein